MKKQNKHVIAIVQDGSIAQELELVPGDILLTVNGQPVEDIFDYRYLMNEEFVVLEVEKANGEIWGWRRNMKKTLGLPLRRI